MNEDAKDLDELVFHPWAVQGPRDVLTLVSGSDFGDRGAVGVIFGVGVAFVADRGGVVGYAMGYLYIAVAAIPLCWWAYRSDEANTNSVRIAASGSGPMRGSVATAVTSSGLRLDDSPRRGRVARAGLGREALRQASRCSPPGTEGLEPGSASPQND